MKKIFLFFGLRHGASKKKKKKKKKKNLKKNKKKKKKIYQSDGKGEEAQV